MSIIGNTVGTTYNPEKLKGSGTKWLTTAINISGGTYPVSGIYGAKKGDFCLNVITGDVCSAGDQYWQYECNIKYTLTEADKADIVTDVLKALPMWEGGSY